MTLDIDEISDEISDEICMKDGGIVLTLLVCGYILTLCAVYVFNCVRSG